MASFIGSVYCPPPRCLWTLRGRVALQEQEDLTTPKIESSARPVATQVSELKYPSKTDSLGGYCPFRTASWPWPGAPDNRDRL